MINDHDVVFDDHAQVDRDDEEEQREEREEREMILTTVQLRRASVMDTLVPQVTIHELVSLGSDLEGSWWMLCGFKGNVCLRGLKLCRASILDTLVLLVTNSESQVMIRRSKNVNV